MDEATTMAVDDSVSDHWAKTEALVFDELPIPTIDSAIEASDSALQVPATQLVAEISEEVQLFDESSQCEPSSEPSPLAPTDSLMVQLGRLDIVDEIDSCLEDDLPEDDSAVDVVAVENSVHEFHTTGESVLENSQKLLSQVPHTLSETTPFSVLDVKQPWAFAGEEDDCPVSPQESELIPFLRCKYILPHAKMFIMPNHNIEWLDTGQTSSLLSLIGDIHCRFKYFGGVESVVALECLTQDLAEKKVIHYEGTHPIWTGKVMRVPLIAACRDNLKELFRIFEHQIGNHLDSIDHAHYVYHFPFDPGATLLPVTLGYKNLFADDITGLGVSGAFLMEHFGSGWVCAMRHTQPLTTCVVLKWLEEYVLYSFFRGNRWGDDIYSVALSLDGFHIFFEVSTTFELGIKEAGASFKAAVYASRTQVSRTCGKLVSKMEVEKLSDSAKRKQCSSFEAGNTSHMNQGVDDEIVTLMWFRFWSRETCAQGIILLLKNDLIMYHVIATVLQEKTLPFIAMWLLDSYTTVNDKVAGSVVTQQQNIGAEILFPRFSTGIASNVVSYIILIHVLYKTTIVKEVLHLKEEVIFNCFKSRNITCSMRTNCLNELKKLDEAYCALKARSSKGLLLGTNSDCGKAIAIYFVYYFQKGNGKTVVVWDPGGSTLSVLILKESEGVSEAILKTIATQSMYNAPLSVENFDTQNLNAIVQDDKLPSSLFGFSSSLVTAKSEIVHINLPAQVYPLLHIPIFRSCNDLSNQQNTLPQNLEDKVLNSGGSIVMNVDSSYIAYGPGPVIWLEVGQTMRTQIRQTTEQSIKRLTWDPSPIRS